MEEFRYKSRANKLKVGVQWERRSRYGLRGGSQQYGVILAEVLQIEAQGRCRRQGTLEVEEVQGVREQGKGTRGDPLFLEKAGRNE